MLSIGNKQTKAQHVIGIKLDKAIHAIGKRELSINNHNNVLAIKEPDITPHPIQTIQYVPMGLNKSQNKNYNSLEKRR